MKIRAQVEHIFGYLPHQWEANLQEKLVSNGIRLGKP